MNNNSRFESKYLIDAYKYHKICNHLAVEYELDSFSLASNGKYYVSSLYYDTFDFNAYRQKLWGEYYRVKHRFRSYWSNEEDAKFVKIERKIRIGRLIDKEVENVSVEKYKKYLTDGYWDNDASEYLQRFSNEIKTLDMHPKAKITYQREVYAMRNRGGVRISFDHNMQYSYVLNLFSNGNTHNDLSKYIVMEIKTLKDDNEKLSELVRRFDLSAEPNSKYANAIEHISHGIWQ